MFFLPLVIEKCYLEIEIKMSCRNVTFQVTSTSGDQISLPLTLTNYGCKSDYIVYCNSYISNPCITIVAPNNIFYALSGSGNQLLTYANNTLIETRDITGVLSTQTLIGIDFRPATGQLYLLANGTTGAQLYTLDLSNNCQVAATAIGGLLRTDIGTIIVLNGRTSINFNPVADRLRVITTTGQNFRVNPDTGVTIVDGNLLLNGSTPSIGAIAYTNNQAGAASTVLYGIDTQLKNLVIINPPNTGTVTTVGSLGVNFTDIQGFDIQTVGTTNTASAIFLSNNVSGLYNINLTTGAATLVRRISCCSLAIKDFSYAPVTATDVSNLAVTLYRNGDAVLVSNGINCGYCCRVAICSCDELTATLSGTAPIPRFVVATLSFSV